MRVTTRFALQKQTHCGDMPVLLLGRRDKYFTHVLAKLSGGMGEVFIPVTK